MKDDSHFDMPRTFGNTQALARERETAVAFQCPLPLQSKNDIEVDFEGQRTQMTISRNSGILIFISFQSQDRSDRILAVQFILIRLCLPKGCNFGLKF